MAGFGFKRDCEKFDCMLYGTRVCFIYDSCPACPHAVCSACWKNEGCTNPVKSNEEDETNEEDE